MFCVVLNTLQEFGSFFYTLELLFTQTILHYPNVYFITIVIFVLTVIMTQFMSNVVAVTLLLPIVIAIANTIGVIPSAMIMVLGIASTMSILTPIACPPANLIYSYGGYKFNDYLKSNIGLTFVFLVACVVMIPMIWPLYA